MKKSMSVDWLQHCDVRATFDEHIQGPFITDCGQDVQWQLSGTGPIFEGQDLRALKLRAGDALPLPDHGVNEDGTFYTHAYLSAEDVDKEYDLVAVVRKAVTLFEDYPLFTGCPATRLNVRYRFFIISNDAEIFIFYRDAPGHLYYAKGTTLVKCDALTRAVFDRHFSFIIDYEGVRYDRHRVHVRLKQPLVIGSNVYTSIRIPHEIHDLEDRYEDEDGDILHLMTFRLLGDSRYDERRDPAEMGPHYRNVCRDVRQISLWWRELVLTAQTYRAFNHNKGWFDLGQTVAQTTSEWFRKVHDQLESTPKKDLSFSFPIYGDDTKI